MKKIITFGSLVLLAVFGLVACSMNSKKLSEENIDRIHFTITNGSIYQFQETDLNIKKKEMVSSIVDSLDELELSQKDEVKDTGGLVGANTYTLDLNRGTKFVRRYMIYGDYITIGKEKNHQVIYKVNHEKLDDLMKTLDDLAEADNDQQGE